MFARRFARLQELQREVREMQRAQDEERRRQLTEAALEALKVVENHSGSAR